MGRPKRETTLLDIAEAERVVSELVERQGLKISVLDFMRLNIQKFKDTGLSRQTIYERLTSEGLDLGTFSSFSRRWTRVEKSVFPGIPCDTNSPVKAARLEEHKEEPERKVEQEREFEKEKVKPKAEEPRKKPAASLGLRPIRMPDGTEVEITSTGAKRFKI